MTQSPKKDLFLTAPQNNSLQYLESFAVSNAATAMSACSRNNILFPVLYEKRADLNDISSNEMQRTERYCVNAIGMGKVQWAILGIFRTVNSNEEQVISITEVDRGFKIELKFKYRAV